MTTAYTSLLGLALPVTGELSGTWGDVVNNSITSLLDSAVAGTTNVSTDADVTLTTTTGAANTAREAILLFSGARTALRTVTAPAQSKIYTVINATTGGYAVKLVGSGPTTGVTIANGSSTTVAWNGSDFVEVSSPSSIILPNGTANGVLYLNGSKVVTSGSALTFDGNVLALSQAGATGLTLTSTASQAYINLRSVATSGFEPFIGFGDTSAGNIGQMIGINGGGLRWTTGGSEQMRLTSTGLGIGTSSPAYKLEVQTSTTSAAIWAQTGGTTSGHTITDFRTGTNASAFATFGDTSSVWQGGGMTLNASGNLGLGVTPSAWGSNWKSLDMAYATTVATNDSGTAAFGSNWRNDGTNYIYKSGGYAGMYLSSSATSSVHRWFTAASGTAGNAITFTQAMTLDASGNLGIGTSSPSTYVSNRGLAIVGLFGTSSKAMTIYNDSGANASNVARIDFKLNNTFSNSSTSAAIYGMNPNASANNGGALVFAVSSDGTNTDPSERARIDSSGNFNVGVTTTLASGISCATGANTTQLALRYTANASGKYYTLGSWSNNGSSFVIQSSAGAGVALASESAQSWSSYSDVRLKNITGRIDNAINGVMALEPIRFTWKRDAENKPCVGLSAQSVQTVLPEVVDEMENFGDLEDKTKYLSVRYTETIPLLVAAIQEQQAIIESLKARLDAANL